MTARYGPVDLPGFTLQRPLGSGGFADVFLYAQHLPRRMVAVKIMHQPVDDRAARARFESEANLMAALSSHPSIVTIHHAAIADNGRPYLVMEYCSRPTLAETYPTRVVTVPELLQTMVRLCGAVETAHRAGILHRDIKPGNILTTDYGWPALTDFGLSSISGAAADAAGISVPWSAPEVVSGRGFDARSDVYALAATAYTVLAGRTPFENPDAPTDLTRLVTRVLTQPAPPLGRDDVPPALERLIHTALAKDPDRRSQSAAEFARSLQRIEQDLHLPMTHLDIPALATRSDEAPAGPADGDDDAEATRFAARRRTEAEAESQDDAEAAPAEEADEPQDQTVLAARAVPRAAPADPEPLPDDAEPTRLAGSRRRDLRRAEAGEQTPGPRRGIPDEPVADRAGGPAGTPHDEEPTRLVERAAPLSPAAVSTPAEAEAAAGGRRAHDPGVDAARETYGIRRVDAVPIVRAAAPSTTPVEPAARPVTRPRRRLGVVTAIAVGATVLVLAVCVAAIALLVGL
ncbi:serine/threonine protein kinase [Microbacterium sp. Sa4CUA7]|uniref:non-specific serine/threonine protein kinase n=1 Tax=Microbacterium pullorum TaxID=2762236 RepID=A0ABR8S0C4_9MICO|nr:serine/threonine-protein kinase [Microbacterium pullorum]MBD7956947.1 serine/threonine protein kinase [Microbacterium pullorum]